METELKQAEEIFRRTRKALQEFNEIITPVIENAKDEHERLYWHHIYEEEDHRLDRLNHLIPILEDGSPSNQGEWIRLLQDISLEKFGLHNFLEHLDLSLFSFKDSGFEEDIRNLRDQTAEDYEKAKQVLEQLNNEIDADVAYTAATPTDEKEGVEESLKVASYTSKPDTSEELSQTKKLTVGSLKKETGV